MFEDKIAIVTGGTGGLGRVVTEKFAEAGMTVYLPVRKISEFRELFDNSKSKESSEFKLRKIYGLQCDAQNEEEVKVFISDVLKRSQQVDYLINTVGGYHAKTSVVDMETDLLNRMIELNLKPTFYFSKYVLKSMIEHNYGRIISIGAMPAVELSAGRYAYSISKSAVVNLMQTIAEECKSNDITANTIIPSIIDTEANRKSMPNSDYSKWVKPEEIADTMLCLVSDSAKSFRGNIIKMYGKV